MKKQGKKLQLKRKAIRDLHNVTGGGGGTMWPGCQSSSYTAHRCSQNTEFSCEDPTAGACV